MKKKDFDYIAKVEKAIEARYGSEAVQNPKANWDEEKEKEYLDQIKLLSEKESKRKEKNQKVEKDGFLISKKLLNKSSREKCPVCGIYSFKTRDDFYFNRYSCCHECYLIFVEDDSYIFEQESPRKERWRLGWRPSKDEVERRRFKKDVGRGA